MPPVMEDDDLVVEAIEQAEEAVDAGIGLDMKPDARIVFEFPERIADRVPLAREILKGIAVVVREGEQDDRRAAHAWSFGSTCVAAAVTVIPASSAQGTMRTRMSLVNQSSATVFGTSAKSAALPIPRVSLDGS